MRRGDLVLVVLPGNLGKPRPAVVVQSDSLRESASVIVCPLTSAMDTNVDLRPAVELGPETGLRLPSRIMVDKVTVVARQRCHGPIGRLSAGQVASLDGSLAFALGLADG